MLLLHIIMQIIAAMVLAPAVDDIDTRLVGWSVPSV